ncbi:Solute carrier family 46 member 3, partial [Orchesella cincta]
IWKIVVVLSFSMNHQNTNSSTSIENNGNGSSGFIDDTAELNDSDDSSQSSSSSNEEDDDSFADNRQIINNNDSHQPEDISCGELLKSITIEPMMFAHMFGMSCTSVILQNLYIQRICRISLNYTDTVCDDLADNPEIEHHIDELASKFVMYRSFIEAGFPIIVSLFLGPWTDIHGCKWPMILPMFGYFLSAMSYVMFSFVDGAPPEALLVSSIPVAACGGLVSIVMSAFSFTSKSTTVDSRSFRVAMVEASWFLGGPLGTLSGGVIYKYGGFTTVFIVSASLFLIAFLYGYIVIKEELPEIEDRDGRNCCTDMFNVEAVKEMFATVFFKRSGLQRRWLLLMLLTISLRIFALFGYIQNMYLYTNHQFGWAVKEYTAYSVSDSFMAISGGYVMIMTCMKIFKLPDAIIGIMSTVGIIVSQFVFAFAASGWMIYLGASLQMFAGLISIVLRSMISKVVAKEEIARVFTFLACGEATMPIVGVPIYSYIFRHTLDTFPGAMFMVSAGTYMFIISSFIYLYFSMRNANNHIQMDDPTETEA